MTPLPLLHSVCLTLIAATACLSADAAPPHEIAPSLRAAVVRLEAAIDPASTGPGLAADLAARQPWNPYETELARRLRTGAIGTGFFVNSRGDLLTNAHVLLSGVRYRGLHFTYAEWDSMTILLNVIRDIWVTVGEGEEARCYLAEPITIAEDLDLALLRLRRPPGDETEFTPLPIAPPDAFRVGDPILVPGFSEDGFDTAAGSIISLIRGLRVHEEMQLVRRRDPDTGQETVTVSGAASGPVLRLQHSAPIGHGTSGAPLLDSRGRVIGVAYALIAQRRPTLEETSPVAGLHLAISSNVLKRFLTRHAVPFTEAAP